MAYSTSFSTTFKVADKSPEQFERYGKPKTSICSQLEHYRQEHCTEILMESPFPSSVEASEVNGFINTVLHCYNRHHNLVIRPDDIWMAVLTQLSFYINRNAEKFRNQFVSFDGKKTLSVTMAGTLRSTPYDLFVTKMTEKIDENLVDKTVKDWILPNFSTTTTNDIVSCGVVFMATMKKYFQYRCVNFCGIPNVTLEGTVADWESIERRLEKLKEYELHEWYDMLKPILKEFVAAKNNKPNVEFWSRICNEESFGSGTSWISGWITAFAVFDENGEWAYRVGSKAWPKIDTDKIPSGIVKVNVKIVDSTVVYESVMFAGHVGYDVLKDKRTLQPQIGWAMALKPTAKDEGKD